MLLLRILAGRILEDGPPLASTTNDHFHVSEITDPPTSVTIELPTESPPQTDEPINVDEEAPPMVPTGDDDVSENGDLDEEPAKETVFVHSMGAWSKPLHFTPPPTPLVPATPKLGVSDATKKNVKKKPTSKANINCVEWNEIMLIYGLLQLIVSEH
ncbi:hypothetical protein Bca52824_040333 [Brassica carinata]|uniref:Uncharacterized protein n=1 Tax=Brassica carinata TaxID=52824 RepID=A0A8X7RXM3_BRACI|nr:hypothetical protein Bca52824_040333 [Brassica carinata]